MTSPDQHATFGYGSGPPSSYPSSHGRGDTFPSEGQRYGPFRVVGDLGVGAMGSVHEVEHHETGAHYALKLIRADEVQDGDALARFTREAQLAARLNHENVVTIHAAELERPPRYLVFDMLTGGTLSHVLAKAGGRLSIEEAHQIAIKICEGLAHAHEHGVLHRDIKPANVLFDAQGKPQLTDFGLSRPVWGGDRLTQTGQLLGTPLFMAPEAVIDSKRADARGDVYGMGALLYLMLAGQPPVLPGASMIDTLQRVCTEKVPRLSKLRPDVPPWLEAITMKAIAKEPRDRYQTSTDLLEALVAGEPSGATAGSRTWPLMTAAVSTLLLAAGAIGWGLSASDTPESISPPAEPTRVEASPSPSKAAQPTGRRAWTLVGAGDMLSLTYAYTRTDPPFVLNLLAEVAASHPDEGWERLELKVVRVRANGPGLERFDTNPARKKGDDGLSWGSLDKQTCRFDLEEGATATQVKVSTPFEIQLAGDFAGDVLRTIATWVGSEGWASMWAEWSRLPVEGSGVPRAGRVGVSPGGRLLWVVSEREAGWASAYVVSRAEKPDRIREGRALPAAREAELIATNGVERSQAPLTDHAVLELLDDPPWESAERGPPFRRLAAGGNEALAYARPWGAVLGKLVASAPYLHLGEPSDLPWTRIQWAGHEAWVPRGDLERVEDPGWVALITADFLNVRIARDSQSQILGAFLNGLVTPLAVSPEVAAFPDYPDAYWAQPPSVWLPVAFDHRKGWIRSTATFTGRPKTRFYTLLAQSDDEYDPVRHGWLFPGTNLPMPERRR